MLNRLICIFVFSFQEVDKEKQKRESEEMGDAMRALENRTQDSKREMDVMAALDEMKSMKVDVSVVVCLVISRQILFFCNLIDVWV